MSVALLIKGDASGFGNAVAWAHRIARARKRALHIFAREEVAAKPSITQIRCDPESPPSDSWALAALESIAASDRASGKDLETIGAAGESASGESAAEAPTPIHPPTPVTLWRITGDAGRETLAPTLSEHDVGLLIIARDDAPRSDREADALDVDLLERATSATMILRLAAIQTKDPQRPAGDRKRVRLLVPVDLDPVAGHALRMALDVARSEDGEVTTLLALDEDSARTIPALQASVDSTPDKDKASSADPVAIGERLLTRILDSLSAEDRSRIRPLVVLGDSVRSVIDEASQDADLIFCGAHRARWRQGRLRGAISSGLLDRKDGPSVAVVRQPIAATGRISRWIGERLRAHVPQMEREARVDLVERIQSNSTWNFDFIVLVCLSTLIASFGLIQNSSAVVIGAMLVAPLMTPLVGAGLALVQSNTQLMRAATRALFLGFLVAFTLAAIAGFVTPGLTITDQIAARAKPGVLDLLVAGFSGIAAAYAMTRKNLSAALPGVAIAAALVPPIASAGLGLAAGEYAVTAGALLLFLSNIVAIVLGSTWSLWLTGVRVAHAHGTAGLWIFNVLIPLVAVTAMLASPMTAAWVAPGDALAKDLKPAFHDYLSERPGIDFQGLRVDIEDDTILIEVRIDTTSLPSEALAAKLSEVAETAIEDDRPIQIRLIPRIVIRASSDDGPNEDPNRDEAHDDADSREDEEP